MVNNIKDLQKFLLFSIAFLVPVIFLPIFPNYFLTPKLIILSFGVFLILGFKAIETILSGKLEFRLSRFDIPVVILLVSFIASAILRTPNKMEAFFLPGTATIIICSVLFYFFLNQLKATDKKYLILSTSLSGVVVSIISLLSAGKILSSFSFLPEFMKTNTFTPLGGNLAVIIFIGGLIPALIGLIISESKSAFKLIYSSLLGILTIGLLVNIYTILPGKPASPQLGDFNTSWFVTVDTLKESPILGIGPGNYLTAFNQYKPLTYNSTAFWTLRFSSARNFFMTIITETGLLGLSGLILLAIALYRSFEENSKKPTQANWDIAVSPNFLSLLVLLVLFILFSPEIASILLLFILLSLNSEGKIVSINLSAQAPTQLEEKGSSSNFPAYIVSVPFLIVSFVFFFFSVRVIKAEYTFNQSLNALAKNDGVKTYDLLSKSISLNRFVDRYHSAMAQVTMGIANSIAQNATQNAKTDDKGQVQISDADRQTISNLIQQSINEAKATVNLNPTRAGNWELLGNIYRSVMLFAQGADQFALESLNQAVALDPTSPELRINLGGVYYALGDYDSAIDILKIAVLAKPDLANTRYNLAAAYREKKDFDKAISEMTVVLSLIDKNSPDYETAKKELEDLQAKKPTQELQGGENLTPPQTAEELVVEPPIDLPEDAQPPEPQTTPQPTPIGTPVSSPTPEP